MELKKILLIKNSNTQMSSSWISNGLGIIATIIHNAGYEVKVIDNNTIYKFYEDEDILRIIREFKPNVIGYSITLYNAYATYKQIRKIRHAFPGLLIIAGGIHMRYYSEEALRSDVDIVINREGEKIILSLLKHLEKQEQPNGIKFQEKFNKEDLDKIKGISFIKNDGNFHIAREFPILKDLDDIPIINYRLFNYEDFVKKEIPERDTFILTGQRGCPFFCNFCSDKIQRADKRQASAEWMSNNIRDLYENYNVKNLFIGDNNITLFKDRLIKLCNKLIESGLNKKISLVCQTTARFPIKEELLILMKTAGFNEIIFGIERLTSYSLEMINKKQSVNTIKGILRLCRKQNIKASIFMMIGFPFETKELLEEEKMLFLELSELAYDFHLSVLTPLPATIYYDNYPENREWYLDEEEYLLRKTYFNNVLNYSLKYTIEKNQFGLSKEVKEALINYSLSFNKRGRYASIDFLVAKISRGIFVLSPSLEFRIFKRLRILRHELGNLLKPKDNYSLISS